LKRGTRIRSINKKGVGFIGEIEKVLSDAPHGATLQVEIEDAQVKSTYSRTVLVVVN
jgi:hypothetical protein